MDRIEKLLLLGCAALLAFAAGFGYIQYLRWTNQMSWVQENCTRTGQVKKSTTIQNQIIGDSIMPTPVVITQHEYSCKNGTLIWSTY